MATGNSRDVRLNLLVETLGQENVDRLRVALEQLSAEGGEAAPEFQALSDQIDRLSQQADAVRTVQRLSEESGELAGRQANAAQRVKELADRFVELAPAVQTAAAAQRQARDDLQAAQTAYSAITGDLKLLRAEYDAAGKKTEEYKTKLRDLIEQQTAQRAAIISGRAALRDANEGLRDAEAAQDKLTKAQERASKAADAAGKAVATQAKALADAVASAEALGVATGDLAAAEVQIAAATDAVTQAATGHVQVLRATAAAQEEAAAASARTFEAMRQEVQQARELEESFAQLRTGVAAFADAQERATADQAAWQREAQGIVEAAEAAQRLARETEVMAAAQRELAAQRAFEKQAQDAQQLLRAAEYVRFWERELDAADQQARETAQAAEEASRRIASAFSTVGVRSVEELQREIEQVRNGMATLAGAAGLTGGALRTAFASGNQRIAELEREIRGLTGQLTLADRAADLFKNSLGQIAAGNVIADAVGYLVNKVKELGTAFIEVVTRTERTRKGLQAVYKDARVAAQQFDQLVRVANNAGVAVGSINDSFLRFAAAAHGASIPLATTNELFNAVVRAGATLGQTGEQVAGALDALGQMASKGVVSMEELRQQLGDRLPGALSLSAKGLGITEAQLIKLVESGALATEDFFPALAKGLQTMAGDTDTLTGAWERFKNMLTASAQAIGDAGGLDVLKGAVRALGVAVGVVVVPLQGFVEALNLAGKGIGLFLGALTTGNFKQAMEEFRAEIDKSATRIKTLHTAIDSALGGTDAQTRAIDQNTAAFARGTSGIARYAAAQERAANAAGAGAQGYVAQMVRIAENASAAENATLASEKLLRAKQEEGKALTVTAQMTGDAVKALDAQVTATNANLVASENVLAARQREVTITQSLITAIRDSANATGQLSSAKQQQLLEAEKELTTQQAALEQARASTLELQRQAAAAQTAAAAYNDNSTRLSAYAQAMESSAALANVLAQSVESQSKALARLKIDVDNGIQSQEYYNIAEQNLLKTKAMLTQANLDAAKNENLYRDAVKDSIAAEQRRTAAAAAALKISQAQAATAEARYQTMAREARAIGDTNLAVYAEIEARRARIKAIELEIRIQELSLTSKEKELKILRDSIKGLDDESRARREKIDIDLQLVQAQREGINLQRENIKGIQAEIDALRLSNEQRGGSVVLIGNESAELDKNTDARLRNAGAAEKQAKAVRQLTEQEENLQRGRTKDGFGIDTQGNKVVAGSDVQTRTGIFNWLKSAGLDEEAARRVSGEFVNSRGEVQYFDNPGQKKYGGSTITDALSKAVDRNLFSGSSRATPRSEGSTTHNVNITLPDGSTDTVAASSEADAQKLVNLLKRLKGTAS